MQKRKEYNNVVSKMLGQGIWISLFIFIVSILFSLNVQAADRVPSIVKAQLINNQDIELYWSEEVTGAGWVESKNVNGSLLVQEQNYVVTVAGIENPIYYYCLQIRTIMSTKVLYITIQGIVTILRIPTAQRRQYGLQIRLQI